MKFQNEKIALKRLGFPLKHVYNYIIFSIYVSWHCRELDQKVDSNPSKFLFFNYSQSLVLNPLSKNKKKQSLSINFDIFR